MGFLTRISRGAAVNLRALRSGCVGDPVPGMAARHLLRIGKDFGGGSVGSADNGYGGHWENAALREDAEAHDPALLSQKRPLGGRPHLVDKQIGQEPEDEDQRDELPAWQDDIPDRIHDTLPPCLPPWFHPFNLAPCIADSQS